MSDAKILYEQHGNVSIERHDDGSSTVKIDVPAGWEVDVYEKLQGGQPNGIGEIEPSWYREWFRDGRESHDRRETEVTIIGPWVKR